MGYFAGHLNAETFRCGKKRLAGQHLFEAFRSRTDGGTRDGAIFHGRAFIVLGDTVLEVAVKCEMFQTLRALKRHAVLDLTSKALASFGRHSLSRRDVF